jgi:5'-deoxynucleotidase YfbR-like HD superfamily hydrolase
MTHLTKLFSLVELSRSQPQYGYALSGIPLHELSSLAAHHYLVTFFAWQIATNLLAAGAVIDIQKVLELCLVHDLGELFGGDIGMPYARINPQAKLLAKAFEKENQRFLSRYFGEQQSSFQSLCAQIMTTSSDEGYITKIADYLEVTHYKLYVNRLSDRDLDLIRPKLYETISQFSDPIAGTTLKGFVDEWLTDLPRFANPIELLTSNH